VKAGVGRRHRGRELALKVLFELEGTDRDAAAALDYQIADAEAPDDVAAFARQLVYGTLTHLDEVDEAIASSSANWRLAEIGKVERAVLRLGAYELIVERHTPVGVAIDEAIELARRYGAAGSPAFVNGVLDRLRKGAASPA
jgi:N utilization substance protein B